MNVLQLDSSPQENSASVALTTEMVQMLAGAVCGLVVTRRDLGHEPPPHLTPHAVTAIRTANEPSQEVAATRAHSDALIAELEAADLIVIGSPMYNFGITTQLKAWFDHVLRAGRTFRYTPEGPVGLLPGKQAVVIQTRGGVYSVGPAQARDHQEPHLRTMLGFIGITDLSFIHAEGLGISPASREAGLAAARAKVAAWVGSKVASKALEPGSV